MVQFAVEGDRPAGGFSGRVEHVASGESVRFGSFEELTSFLARKLGSASVDAGATKGSGS